MKTSTSPARKLYSSRRSRAGFSLVEVAMAIGIFAFAFTAVFGLLPVGLANFRQAKNASLGSEIAQRLINEWSQKDFDTLLTSSTVREYSDEGNWGGLPSIYMVNIVVKPSTNLPTGTASTANTNLATLIVQVMYNPGRATPDVDATTKLWTGTAKGRNVAADMNTYTAYVSRNQGGTITQ